MYHNFLIIISQLNRTKKARLICDDIELHIEESNNKKLWVLSATIYRNNEKIPLSVQQCVFSCGMLQWQDFGPYLKLDGPKNSIKLLQHVGVPEGFIAFRGLIKNFTMIAREWKETLLELSGNGPSLTAKSL